MAKSAGNWEDNFSKIVNQILKVDSNKEWRFTLEEHKTKGTMQLNVRKWNLGKGVEGEYVGPTKNGFIESVTSLEDIEKLEKAFADYFKEVKKML